MLYLGVGIVIFARYDKSYVRLDVVINDLRRDINSVIFKEQLFGSI